MDILFDLFQAQPSGNSKFHGGGEYIKTIFRELIIVNNGNHDISVFYDCEKFLDEWVLSLINDNKINVFDVKNMKDIEEVLKNNNYDVFYSGIPYKYYEIEMPEKTRKIGTFHGLRTAEKPSDKYAYMYSSGRASIKMRIKYMINDFFQKKAAANYRKGLVAFDDIITDSTHSKYALQCLCEDVDINSVHVFYAPAKYIDNNSTIRIVDDKYILIIGGNRWEKNTVRAIIALEELFKLKKIGGYKVVIVGRLPSKVLRLIKHKENYIFFDYVQTSELESLYYNCDFFIYPSLNEGFGLPPLEAMRYGKTCIVSGVCSLPEVCGDGVIYVNPYDIKEIENRILWAVHEKIDKEKVIAAFNHTYERQKADLIKLCRFILKDAEN